MNRQPRAATSPPTTAVTRVDLRTHSATVTGDNAKATPADNAPRQPETMNWSNYIVCLHVPMCLFMRSLDQSLVEHKRMKRSVARTTLKCLGMPNFDSGLYRLALRSCEKQKVTRVRP